MTMASSAPARIPPIITTNGQYSLDAAAAILGVKKHTLYMRLRRLPGFTPTVIGQRVWVITASDILKIWEMYGG
jgi:hypothetical protein